MSPPVIEVSDLTFDYPGFRALDRVSLSIAPGSVTALVGPNGAGKTTLLQVAAAQIHPTEGVAGILGEVLGTVDVFDLRPRIGLTSAALADLIPRGERVHDVVVSASYAMLGRWREVYDDLDHERAASLLTEVGDERRVHLDDVDGKLLEVAQRRIASAEVVEGQHHAEVLELGQHM